MRRKWTSIPEKIYTYKNYRVLVFYPLDQATRSKREYLLKWLVEEDSHRWITKLTKVSKRSVKSAWVRERKHLAIKRFMDRYA